MPPSPAPLPPYASLDLDDARVVEVLSPFLADNRLARMRSVLDHRVEGVVLGLEDLHHLHNAAACLRTAEGMGLQDVVAVELHDNGTYKTLWLDKDELRRAEQQFLACLTVYGFMTKHHLKGKA